LIRVTHQGAVATLELARPEARNALSIALCDAIVDGLAEIDAAPDARVVILAGEGKVFCSGADFAAVSGPGGLSFLPRFERMLEAVARFRLPVIARIQGAALGGGLQLATACDFRFASTDAKLGIPSSRLGIVINLENVQRLVALVGGPKAKEILMTGTTISGAEGHSAGLVTQAHPEAELEGVTAAFAAEIGRLAPLSVQGAKRAIDEIARWGTDIRNNRPEVAAEIDGLVAAAYNSSDLQEGLAAMTEKRPGHFEGR
jgi:enoyl-CoA hydratase/carnithine racemase